MRRRSRASIVAAVLLALTACSELSRPTLVPTRIKAGQSWVVTRPALAEQVLDTCSRDSPAQVPGRIEGYWAPAPQQVDALEARQQQLSPPIEQPASYDRQYVGVVIAGRRLIYINAFRLPDDSPLDPARQAIRICDGGTLAWGALYDPENGRFSEIRSNGPH